MKLLKKNQFVILVIGLMLVTAGYLNYTSTNNSIETGINSLDMAALGDAKLVSSSNVTEENRVEEKEPEAEENTIEEKNTSDSVNTEQEKQEENNVEDKTEQTSSNPKNTSYFVSSRLERDTMYSQMLESYQKIIDSTSVGQEQKAIATQEITKINQTKNAIMIAENLIKTKGFEECILFVNDASISCIVKADQVQQESIAQIQNIVARELKAEIENIHISNK